MVAVRKSTYVLRVLSGVVVAEVVIAVAVEDVVAGMFNVGTICGVEAE